MAGPDREGPIYESVAVNPRNARQHFNARQPSSCTVKLRVHHESHAEKPFVKGRLLARERAVDPGPRHVGAAVGSACRSRSEIATTRPMKTHMNGSISGSSEPFSVSAETGIEIELGFESRQLS
jgi:hypothetical protein